MTRLRPAGWSIATRSAGIAAVVVLVALTVAGTGLAALLYRQLLAGLDDAAVGRLRDIAVSLQTEPAADLDAAEIATDQRIAVVQVIDASGRVVVASDSAPDAPVVDPGSVGAELRSGVEPPGTDDLRVSGQRVPGRGGQYIVIVAAGTEAVESTVRAAVILLAVAAPIVTTVSASAGYFLVRRSMRSVEAIRARVADISASDLTGRVPVPDGRDEIAALAVTMNEMLARIEAGHNAQRQFIGDASHELRSPITTIISALEVAAAHPHLLNAELADGMLMPEAQRMRTLIEDLLLLAHADERGITLRRNDVDLDDLVDSEVVRLRRMTPLTVHPELIPTRVIGDEDRLARMLRNVVDNAARHARRRVEITLRHTGPMAVVTVADDGPGIPEPDRDRVFDRFVRLDADRSRRAGGSGLGLAIVAEIVAAHGGSVSIDDRPGGGASVTIRIPVAGH